MKCFSFHFSSIEKSKNSNIKQEISENIKDFKDFKKNPLENFDHYKLQDKDPNKILNKGPVRGFSKWRDQITGEVSWKECSVLEYEEKNAGFLIEWTHNSQKKRVFTIKS